MAQQESKSASLGRNLSGDFIKRRKSWQDHAKTPKLRPLPDVRTLLQGADKSHKGQTLSGKRGKYVSNLWRSVFTFFLTCLAVGAVAGFLLATLAVSLHSEPFYAQWVDARDGTVEYFQQLDWIQAIALGATFGGALLVVVCSYVFFFFIVAKMEGRAERASAGLEEIKSSDLEQGDAHLQTKHSIAKLMGDAEKQYVAEYSRKSSAAGVMHTTPGDVADQQLEEAGGIKVHRLAEARSESSPGSRPQGATPPRLWSLKHMLSIRRVDLPQDEAALAAQRSPSPDWAVNSADLAAQLSSPDAFNRASSSQKWTHGHSTSRPGEVVSVRQDSDPATPATPTMGELMRQRRETFILTGDGEEPSRQESTRIKVTKPLEARGEGPAPSEDEEDEFDRERQHSYVPHPAGDAPFTSMILRRDLNYSEADEEELDGSIGWHDVGLESDHEGRTFSLDPAHSAQQAGHMVAGAAGIQERQASVIKPAEITELHPIADLKQHEEQVKCYIDAEIEEVLPRPQAGLLNRLLRLARVESFHAPERGPTFIIQPGKEYMVGLRLRYPGPRERRMCAKWIRIQPPDGQPVRFNIQEESRKEEEWAGSACWDTSLHSSETLSFSQIEDGRESIPIRLTIGLEDIDLATYKLEAKGKMHVILRDALPGGVRPRTDKDTESPPRSAGAAFYLI